MKSAPATISITTATSIRWTSVNFRFCLKFPSQQLILEPFSVVNPGIMRVRLWFDRVHSGAAMGSREGPAMQSNSWSGVFGWVVLFLEAAPAVALPPNFYDESIADDWNQALGLTFASDGRMLVWEKAGRVWIVEDGGKSAAPLIDISEEVGD